MSTPDFSTFSPSTAAAQALGYLDPSTGAFVPPIQPGTTYERDTGNRLLSGRLYSRADNPGYEQPEAVVAHLEGGAAAALFGSGVAAGAVVFQALKTGDHVVIPRVMYWALRGWIDNFAASWGLRVTVADMTDLAAVAAAVRPGETRLVWVETPANPTLDVTDIAAVAEIARRAGARLAVDSTFATPVHTRPLELGADLVMHSATKYLNGHSDVIAGVVVTRAADDFWARIKVLRFQAGAVLGPFEAWLLLRGLRTLFLRVTAQSRSAEAIARRFENDPRVRVVLYPGLETHPGHGIARRQMKDGYGGMLSLCVKGGAPAALAVVAKLRLWKRATSLGGVESLVEHRASVEGPGSPTPADLLRLSTGIEATADLIADLDAALGG
jgi:cystathionine gamma-synthase